MTWLQIIVLAVVQGLTEFLPISSSGHLILVPAFFNWADQGLSFDVAVHFGSLVAVLIFFRNDIAGLFRGAGDILAGRADTLQARMAWCIGIGTIPAAVAGLLFAGWIAENLRSPLIVVMTLSAYGVLMALADRLAEAFARELDDQLRHHGNDDAEADHVDQDGDEDEGQCAP